ncbi:DUF551 domain-containing protein [Klebsiella pneumoniae]
MTSKFTREELLNIIDTDHVQCGEASALARMALAAMDGEPVAWLLSGGGTKNVVCFDSGNAYADPLREVTPLYRHAQPAPVSYSDFEEFWSAYIHPLAQDDELKGFAWDIWSVLGSNSQPAPVVPEEVTAEDCPALVKYDVTEVDEAWARGFNACRAAMLQAEPVCTCPSGDGSLRRPCPVHPGNSPVIPDGWTCNDKANAALMMLDRIETVDPVDDDRIDGIKRIVRELAAAPHDTPALNSIQSVDTVADRWIPVSERMPEVGDIVLTAMGGVVNVGETECSAANCRFFTSVISGRELPATHWMPLPAAPKEVKGE